MKTKVLPIVLIAIFFAGSVIAQKPIQDEKGKRIAMAQKFKQKRAMGEKGFSFFTDEQKEAMKVLRLEQVKALKPLKDQLRELQARHQTLKTAVSADLDAIFASIEKMGKVKTEMAKIQAKNVQDVRALLTEEQLLKFDAMKSRHKRMQPGKRLEERRRI